MKYPGGIKQRVNTSINYANRGMGLESDINVTNEFYRINNIAIVYKKPTPITVSKVDYKKGIIEEAYYKTPSTTDYNGIYKGKYIDFEAKETKSSTSFPLNNIHNHQIEHLRLIKEHGGIGFIIVRFTLINETYLLTYNELETFLKSFNKKSIPLSYFKEHGFLIKDKFNPRVDYIKIIDDILERNV